MEDVTSLSFPERVQTRILSADAAVPEYKSHPHAADFSGAEIDIKIPCMSILVVDVYHGFSPSLYMGEICITVCRKIHT